MKKILTIALLAAAVLSAVTGCKDSGGDEVNVESIEVSPKSVTVGSGKTEALTAVVKPATATNKKVLWESLDPTVASVDDKGVVKGLKIGETTIVARPEARRARTAECKVTVVNPNPATGLKLPATQKMAVSTSIALTAETTPGDAVIELWSSDKPDVVSVESFEGNKCELKGLKTGSSVITVRSGTQSAKCTVEVVKSGVIIDPAEATIYVDATKQITATALPSGTITWSSDNTGVATVGTTGLVKGVKAGTANIKATAPNGDYAACKITVKANTISLNKTTLTLYPNRSETLTATTVPAGSTVTWSTGDSSIATVANGTVTAKTVTAATTVTITAKANGVEAKCTVTVKPFAISLNKTTLTLYPNQTETLTTTVEPSGSAVTWKSSNTNVATVANGTVTAKTVTAANTVTITATANGIEAKCTVTVNPFSIRIDRALVLYVGESVRDKVYVEPSNSTVTWSSNNTSIAMVNNYGTVIGQAVGTTTITATANGVSTGATVRVIAMPSRGVFVENQSDDYDYGTVWAEVNVGKPGTFEVDDADYGLFYPWGRSVGWNNGSALKDSNGGTTWNPSPVAGTYWTTTDPCPSGWRIPTKAEFQNLVELPGSYASGQWRFRYAGTAANPKYLNFVAAGIRASANGAHTGWGVYGYYWTGEIDIGDNALAFYFRDGNHYLASVHKASAISVRCVHIRK